MENILNNTHQKIQDVINSLEALKAYQEEIEKLEARDAEITELLSDPSIGTDLGKLRKLSDEQNELQENLQRLYDEWEELSL